MIRNGNVTGIFPADNCAIIVIMILTSDQRIAG